MALPCAQTDTSKGKRFMRHTPISPRCCTARWQLWTRRRLKATASLDRGCAGIQSMKAAEEKIAFAGAEQNRIKHVIYIIKENRTYDQISAT